MIVAEKRWLPKLTGKTLVTAGTDDIAKAVAKSLAAPAIKLKRKSAWKKSSR